MDPLKDPTNYSWITYGWVLLLAALGGFVSVARKARRHGWQSVKEVFIDLVISAFSGLVTFFLCEGAAIKPQWTAALVAISGHMGSRAIFQIEKLIRARFPHI